MKFNVTVIRTDQYEIEIDENIWNKEARENWGKVFHEVNDVEDVVKDFAVAYMRTDTHFIEGYGYPKVLYKDGTAKRMMYMNDQNKLENVPEEKMTKGLIIKPIDEDEDYETEIEKI